MEYEVSVEEIEQGATASTSMQACLRMKRWPLPGEREGKAPPLLRDGGSSVLITGRGAPGRRIFPRARCPFPGKKDVAGTCRKRILRITWMPFPRSCRQDTGRAGIEVHRQLRMQQVRCPGTRNGRAQDIRVPCRRGGSPVGIRTKSCPYPGDRRCSYRAEAGGACNDRGDRKAFGVGARKRRWLRRPGSSCRELLKSDP